MEHVRLTERVYLNADRDKAVEESSEEAAFLLGIPGQLIPKDYADEIGAPYGENVSGDAAKDVVHIEVETPNVFPGPPVEGSGKATIPVTQADRAAMELDRETVSGKDRRRTEGEAFLDGELKPRKGQRVMGDSGRAKQVAAPEPGTTGAENLPNSDDESGTKQADRPKDKSATSSSSSKNK